MWENQGDIERDLLLFAEFSTPPVNDNEPIVIPEAILRYRQQMEENKRKVLNSDLDEITSATHVISGRGRGIHNRIVRLGEIVQHHPIDDIELKKKIREVSGLGYSNELIQRTLKAARESSEPSTASAYPDLVWSDPIPMSSKSSTAFSPRTSSPLPLERYREDSSPQHYRFEGVSSSSRPKMQRHVRAQKRHNFTNNTTNPSENSYWRSVNSKSSDKSCFNQEDFPPL